MKRHIAGIAAGAVLLLGLVGCKPTSTPNPAPNSDTTTTATTTVPITAPTVVLQDELAKPQVGAQYEWINDLPRMDGSTSTIPLEAGLRAALFGISQAEAELTVSHTTTYGSFENLIDGNCDLIFSVPMSDDQIAQAADKGMELEMTKIAAEGFVFVVNAKNPVDTLTQQQLKDIYSGKITNWKEVGGNDAPISAYQRNETSGSQNFMHTFMGDTPLMEPTTDFTPTSMGYLMDAIAVYDNAENAIGYSVYAYAADMYGNGNEIKFIKVDGVAPSKATMADGSYPLLGYNYAVYDKKTPVDSPLRQFVNWIASEEGQRAVKAAGYVPILPVGELPETAIRLYTAVGSGPEKPADYEPAIYQYVAVDSEGDWWAADGEQIINAIRNQTTKELIEDFIDDAKESLLKEFGKPTKTHVICRVVNGYMQVSVSLYEAPGTHVQRAIFDLIEGKRLISSDLFFKGADFITPVNKILADKFSASAEEGYYGHIALKREFLGLPAEGTNFDLNIITLQAGLYTLESHMVYTSRIYECSVLSLPRDMSGVFDDSVRIRRMFSLADADVIYESLVMDKNYAALLSPSVGSEAVAEKINNSVRGYCKSQMSTDAIYSWYRSNYGPYTYGSEGAWVDAELLGNRYVMFSGVAVIFAREAFVSPPIERMVHFYDLATGDEVAYTIFLKDGWKNAGNWMYEGQSIPAPDLANATLCEFATEGATVSLSFLWNNPQMPYATVTVPEEYINWDA